MKERISVISMLLVAFISGAILYHYYFRLMRNDLLADGFIRLQKPPMPSRANVHKGNENNLPRLLVIGDSISQGYLSPLRQTLTTKFHVVHVGDNARDTAYTLSRLQEWLHVLPYYEIIVFNNGLHDLKFVNEKGNLTDSKSGRANVPLAAYQQNMNEIVAILKATGSRLIFATTTPVPKSALGYVAGSEYLYNETAIDIMRRNGVAVCDLHTIALPMLSLIQRPDDIHFNPIGQWILANGLAAVVLGFQQDMDTKMNGSSSEAGGSVTSANG